MNCWFAKRVSHKTILVKSALMLLGFLLAGCGGVAAENPGQSINTLGTGGRPAIVIGDDAAVVATLWDGAEYGYVRIETAEAAAQRPNDHPIAFTPQQIRTALRELQTQRHQRQPEPLFTNQGLDDIAAPIATALARAQPDQDVTFAVTGKRGNRLLNLMGKRWVTSGRMFYQDDQLNIIFGTIKGEFEDTLRATGVLRGFTPGSRTRPVTRTKLNVLPAEGIAYASAGREDWLQMAPYAWAVKPPKAPQQTAPVGVPVAPVSTGLTTEQGDAASMDTVTPPPSKTTASVAAEVPTNTSSPIPAASFKPPAAAAADPKARSDEAHYQQFEKRLATLRKLRDRNVITEKEYQEKRRAILGEL